jgi:hypothetical protein
VFLCGFEISRSALKLVAAESQHASTPKLLKQATYVFSCPSLPLPAPPEELGNKN